MNPLGDADVFLLEIDGGDSRSRVPLCGLPGKKVGGGIGDRSNSRLGVDQRFVHIDALAQRPIAFGVDRLSLAGCLAASIEPWLGDATRHHFVAPLGDGARRLARDAAESASDLTISRRPR
jgi:N-acetylglucosamine kinase-like BadF-type ATPase